MKQRTHLFLALVTLTIFAVGMAFSQVIRQQIGLTAGAKAVTGSAATDVDLQTATGFSADDFQRLAVQNGSVLFRIAVASEAAVTDGRVAFNTASTTTTLNGSTAALTGQILNEGESVTFQATGRWLNLYGVNGNTKVIVTRVQ
jgi:hypothetical protein